METTQLDTQSDLPCFTGDRAQSTWGGHLPARLKSED